MSTEQKNTPNLFLSLIPLVFLFSLLGLSLYCFGDDCVSGPNQIALFASTIVVFIVSIISGQKYRDLENGMIKGISITLPACLILLFVGALIGVWFISGTIPTMIYFGMNLLHAKVFYPCVAIVCAVVSMCIGSSWNTAATIGIACLGISQGLGLNPLITAGAVISGSYFGDKMSPLSGTTNIASAVSQVNLFSHIKSMTTTTIPSIIISVIMFAVVGLITEPDTGKDSIGNESFRNILNNSFNISLWCILPLAILLYLAVKRTHSIFTICAGIIAGLVIAVIFQYDSITRLLHTDGSVLENIKSLWQITYNGLNLETGNKNFDTLLSGGGMARMLNTVILMFATMSFGSVMECSGCLGRIMSEAVLFINSAGKLVLATVFSAIGINAISGEQSMSVILPGRMYVDLYKNMKIAPTVLSRSLEDGGTITSVLIPWSTCGVYFSGLLKISTLDYLPYCFFNLVNVGMAVLFALLGIGIVKAKDTNQNAGV
jgi:NhaC family Na+:H+ antiporter